MRKRLAIVVVSLAFAGTATAQLTLLGDTATLAETLDKGRTLSPLTVSSDTSWSENWILGAASAAGQFGAYFRTDLFVMAPCAGASGEIVFDLFSLPNGESTSGSQRGKSYSIPPGGFGIIPDVVSLFGQYGGATLLLKVSSSRSTATTSCRELSSWGRTYTLAPGGGEYSTGLLSTFPSVTISSSRYGAITGVQQNADRRTNVIVMTPYSSTGTVRLHIFDHTGSFLGQKDVVVYGYSATQVSLSEFTILPPGGSVRAVAVSPSYFNFQAQAVTVDNRTNDGYLNSFAEHEP